MYPVQYIEAKSILSKLRQQDNWFGISYNMNLYRGCQHGCIYCDTRSECYKIGDISAISVKKNALGLLARELPRKRKEKATIGTGSMNDPYMPVEQELRLTRGALQMIADEKFPVHIITKSNLVTRDLDILQALSKIYAAVSFTITTVRDELARKIEPYAPAPSQRFAAMHELAASGIYTGITYMPVLPYINDTEEEVRAIVQKAKEAGASYILPMFGVTLRKGSRDYFYQALEKHFPGVKSKYITRFNEQYVCYSPHYKNLSDTFLNETGRLNLSTRMKFYSAPFSGQLSLF